MRWSLKCVVIWCGVTVPSGIFSTASAYATLPKVFEPVDTDTKSTIQSLSAGNLAIGPPAIPTIKDYTRLLLTQASPPVSPPESDRDDRFLQPLPTPQPVTPGEAAPITPTPEAPVPIPSTSPTGETTRIQVQRIEVVGSTRFTPEDFAAIVQPVEGRAATLEELRQIADQITQLYLDRGYITSRAVLVEQVIAEGVVQIQVIEGALEAIEVQGNRRVNGEYIRSRIRLGATVPLSQSSLEDQLRLLRLDPLFENVEASLRAGSGLGQSILTVRVTEADPFFGSVSVDNYSPPSVGSERVGIELGYRSLTGLGDELVGYYYRSTTGGSNVFDFSYRIPVNPMNGTIQLRAAPSDYEITDEAFASFDIEGNADLYELSFRQPLVRSPREEFALSLGLTYRDGETLIGGVQFDSSTTSVIRFGQDYIHRDPRGAWAVRSQFNIGTGLFDATSGREPDGQFFSWFGQLQRVQILNPDNFLIIQADLQLTPDALLPSQQFVIGGGQSLRGYRQNVRLGDNGFRLSVEDRMTLQRNEAGASILQLAPFADIGAVWNTEGNPNSLPDQTFLGGIGLGLLWNPFPELDLRLDYSIPLVDLGDRGKNAQDDGFYFNVNYNF